MHPHLEQITRSRNYGDLPETWRVPDIERFSAGKTLYDYQTDALKNAARGLFVYYGDAHDWSAAEAPAVDDARKEMFAGLYGRDIDNLDVKRYETRAAEQNQIENPVFRILSPFIAPQGDAIAYRRLINRMCFWMATGSGKTLVMVKLLEYLHALQKHREIPPHNILMLAPSEHLLGQIRRTVEEFNQTGLRIELVPLRDLHRGRQAQLGDAGRRRHRNHGQEIQLGGVHQKRPRQKHLPEREGIQRIRRAGNRPRRQTPHRFEVAAHARLCGHTRARIARRIQAGATLSPAVDADPGQLGQHRHRKRAQ